MLFVIAGMAAFTALIFGILFFSMHGAHARVRFEKIKRELKEQGRYEEWARSNRTLLFTKALANTGALLGLPVFLFFTWQGYRQLGLVFLGVFAICLIVLLPINRFLYDKIYRDLK